MLVRVRDFASSSVVQILGPLGVVGLIGLGAWIGFGASLLAIALAVAGLLGVVVQQVRSPRWRFRTRALSSDPSRAVVVTLEHEEWDVYQRTAWILRVKVKIRHRTSAEQRLDMWETRWVGAHELRPVPVPGLAAEIAARQRDHPEPSREVPPGRSVEGWLFYRLGYAPVDGVPSYDLLWVSITGHSYGFRRTVPRPRKIDFPTPQD